MILCKETSSKNIKTLAKLYYQRIWAEQSGEQISEGDFTFMYLADAFVQSDLHCIQVTVFTFFFISSCFSLGIEPMILALLAPCSTIWATGKLTSVFTSVAQYSCTTACHSTVTLLQTGILHRNFLSVRYLSGLCFSGEHEWYMSRMHR